LILGKLLEPNPFRACDKQYDTSPWSPCCMSDAGVRLRKLLATGVADHSVLGGLVVGLSGFHHHSVMFAVIVDAGYFFVPRLCRVST
jgi:hypothetical protein